MITYDRLWKTMKKKNISQYVLINKYKISRATISSLKHNRNVTTETLGKLCTILDCKLSDIAEDNDHPE
ncbi:MAG: helix-turn-helix transcriptional regulator [Lachnospiraceae bacterium]|nr:helix-turn-helix transcriptional regulator [Lachnospiraceae bacterium]